jgi:hypothetical protein
MSNLAIKILNSFGSELCVPWKWFQAPSGKDGDSWTVFLRCPACGAVIDWRDQGLHMMFHGVTNQEMIAETEARQKAEWA